MLLNPGAGGSSEALRRRLGGAFAARGVPFDIVEAFTPAPMGDVTVAEARAAWPDKALWLNFTSSVHLEPDEAIRAHARQLIQEAFDRDFGGRAQVSSDEVRAWLGTPEAICATVTEQAARIDT